MAEAIVGSMLGKLQQLAIREGKTLLAVNEDIQSLRDKLMWMQAFLRDVQPSRRVQPNELIKVWLQQTRDAVFDAEDAVDQYFIQIDLSRFPTWSRAMLSFFATFTTQVQVRHNLSRKIKSINARLEGIISNKDRYRMGESSTLGSTWTPSSFTSPLSEKMDIVPLPLVGREKLMGELKDLVHGRGDHQYDVITVTGESGVGKTKLVRDLYDRRHTLYNFDIHEWVSFGLHLSASDVLQLIIGRITDGEECPKEKIKDKLKNILNGKKFLLVIDAELSNSEWNRIFSMIPKEVSAGSRLVRISQSEPDKRPPRIKEARRKVGTFEDQVVMNLFKKTLLRDDRNGPPLEKAIEQYREKILDNAQGLPLAVVLLSGLLRTKEYPNEWKTVFEHLDKMQSKRIDKILSLCFDDLHYDMKSCLLYFAALPVNTFVGAGNIVCMWMAEGFLTPKAKTMENLGQQYLKELIDRCLVNIAPKGYAVPGYERVAVQSKVHAFLQLEAQEQSFVEIHIGDDTPALTTVRRLSLQNHRDKYAALARPLPKLRAILSNFEAEQEAAQDEGKQDGNGTEDRRNPARWYCPNLSVGGARRKKKQAKSCVKELLQNSKFLRVIHFEGLDIGKELPAKVGSVVNLRYLRVTTCSLEKIPPSIGRLHNLQTLDVRRTNVRSLPAQFWRIQMLRHVLGDDLVLPKRVGHLSKLQTLRSVKPDDDAIGWDENTFTNMQRLWYLHIRYSKDLVAKNKAALAKAVCSLDYLVVLIIKAPTIPSEVFFGSKLPRLKAMDLVGKLEVTEDDIHKMRIRTRLPNLEKLRLKQTMVSQKFINQLKGLQSLSILALRSTSYMEEELIFLDGFRSLKELMVHAKDLNRIEIHESALPMLKGLDIVKGRNDLRVEMHGHSNLVEYIKVEDKALFEIMDIIIRQVQVDNGGYSNA